MELRLLGEVQLLAGGRALDVGTPRQQTVLAALAVDAVRPVALDTLVARVWGDDPPAEARSVLYSHLSRIRRVLTQATVLDGVAVQLRRRHAGYLLDLDPDLVDLHRFERLTSLGSEASRSAAERAGALANALSSWRGPPLAGLAGEWVENVREHCHRRRVDAAVRWARLELALGRPDAVVAGLPALVADYPLAEPLEGLVMTALQSVGRRAEALERYAAVRERLADTLGTDPGPDLTAVHESLLRDEPPQGRAAGPATPAVAPAHLPPDVHGFTGRAAQLRALDALLPGPSSAPDEAAPTVVVTGMAGVGKTTLAVHWARRAAARFPDGQLAVNLRGYDPNDEPMKPHDVLHTFLEALGVPRDRVPLTLEAKVGLYRSRLAGQRVLVLLDNARDVEQVRPLLPAAPGCLALVTSRDQLSGLVTTAGAQPLALDLPSADEARSLLLRRFGRLRSVDERGALDDIVALCGRLPLALAIVATRVAVQPHLPLAVLAAELREAQGGLAEFTDADERSDVRAVFSWSYRALSPGAARLFRLLAGHPGPDVGTAAAASITGQTVAEVRAPLAELARAHLLQRVGQRYAFHDLLRAYAVELAGTHDGPADLDAAARRSLDHYLATADEADLLLNPLRDELGPLPVAVPGVTPERLADQRAALAWFKAEHPALLTTLRRSPDDARTWRLAWALNRYLAYQGHWHDSVEALTVAVDAARRRGERADQAAAQRALGCAHLKLERPDDAGVHLDGALRLYADLRDATGEAHTHRNLAWLLQGQGRHREALTHAERAVELFTSAGHDAGRGRALNAVGWFTAQLGDLDGALTYLQQAWEVQRRAGDRFGQAETADSLGYVNRELGRYDAAVSCYRTAIALYQEFDDRYNEADSTASLGDAYAAAGDAASARLAWGRAADLFAAIHHPDAGRIRARAESTPRHDQEVPSG